MVDSSACDLHKKPRSWDSFFNLFRTRNKNVHLRISRSTEGTYSRMPGQLQKRHRRRLCPRSFHQRVRCLDTTDDCLVSDSTSLGDSETEPGYCKPPSLRRPRTLKLNKRSKPKFSQDYKAHSTMAWLAQNCGLDGKSSTEDCDRKGICHAKAPPRGQSRVH
ncbi:hypothetical protein NDU88_003205 [Pleurodeles waltl]|uniref:Uncharacterized protein n=1 Tax=Pleurodeles waltl TaxID=8319 RepID=A0AAV7SFR6_PLEWA|nr:hypothetical protein NDU88_003205 [Pleurodeles waltl]